MAKSKKTYLVAHKALYLKGEGNKMRHAPFGSEVKLAEDVAEKNVNKGWLVEKGKESDRVFKVAVAPEPTGSDDAGTDEGSGTEQS